jgi:hypothetical protein
VVSAELGDVVPVIAAWIAVQMACETLLWAALQVLTITDGFVGRWYISEVTRVITDGDCVPSIRVTRYLFAELAGWRWA